MGIGVFFCINWMWFSFIRNMYIAPMMLPWILFLAIVLFLLALDLGVFHRKDRVIKVGEALAWTGIWVAVSLLFAVAVYFAYDSGFVQGATPHVLGKEAALDYLTAYVVEKSLSMDNVFVMAAIFSYFSIPSLFQHRVLFWGILGSIVLRGIFIGGGAFLLSRFGWLLYVFGLVLVLSGVKMMLAKNVGNDDFQKNKIVQVARRVFPVFPEICGHNFFVKKEGRIFITPLFLSLIVIESSDIVFAMDSIPAVFSVTLDPFIVFTSNIMAVLGLRSLYFAVAAMVERFSKLKYAIAFILVFVGAKMLIAHYVHVATILSLGVIVGALCVGVVWSLVASKRGDVR